MAKVEPIHGHYVYVPYEGEEYRVYFEESGTGIPLVCLHTAGADGRQWRHQLCDPDITKDFRVIAFDLPRHGKSNPPKHYYREEEEYNLTAKFYTEFTMAFCRCLELDKPVILGSSIAGSMCLPLALKFSDELRALIPVQAAEYCPGFWTIPFWHPHMHGGEVCATYVYGLMAPQSPEELRREIWWYYAQGGPGIYKGDIYFHRADHDFRELCEKISGKAPMFFMTGTYDYAATPEACRRTAGRIKNAEFVAMEGIGHFPMCENPKLFKSYLMPVLEKIKKLGVPIDSEEAQ